MSTSAEVGRRASNPVDAAWWLAVCAWCDRVRLEDRWLEQRWAMHELGRGEVETAPSFTHTICPTCFERVTPLGSARYPASAPSGSMATTT